MAYHRVSSLFDRKALPATETTDFEYSSSLSRDELRLLKPENADRSRFSFSISTVSRRSLPAYTAISYAWGDSEASQTIYLNGEPFRIRPNLWSCLYYLARPKKRTWDYIWVDAVCINQRDVTERNAQVRSMDRTYRDADCVSVWLGLTFDAEHLLPLKTNQLVEPLEFDPFNWIGAIDDLTNRPYWSRFWVIQEFLLNKRVDIHCAGSSMSWADFRAMLCFKVGLDPVSTRPNKVLGEATATRFRALPLVLARSMDRSPHNLQTLQTLLEIHRRAECKDARDRVFALLGLVVPEELALLERYFPDYNMTLDHVRIITVAHLKQARVIAGGHKNDPRVTKNSEDVFLGLGVDSPNARKRLLFRASMIDYMGNLTSAQMIALLDEHDIDE